MNTPKITEERICEPELIEVETEILVLGGGLPGVCAAVQAGRMGRKVILVEKSLTLGGNCGPEIGVHPSDAHRFHPYMVSTGIVGELIEEAAFRNAKTDSHDKHYNISIEWDSIMSSALEEAGVTVLRSHYAHTPVMTDDKITAVICEDTLTYTRVRINVTGYVIDDSGDGNVSERAGAVYRMGRESKDEFGERLAPEKADTVTMGASLVSVIRDTHRDMPFSPDKNTPEFYPGYGGDVHITPEGKSDVRFFYPTETGGDIDVIRDGHEVYSRLRRHLDSAWKQAKSYPEQAMKNWELLWVSSKMAKRESRRFEGDYIVTETDVETGRQFDDAVAVGGFAMDVHDPKAEYPEYVQVTYYLLPPVYTIPYRALYSKNINNLFFASRLLSATHLAHGSIRLQRTLASIGQAAGMAAAMCAEYGISPKQLYTEGHTEELRQRLLKEDCTIPNAVNTDTDDLSHTATVTSSSETVYSLPDHAVFKAVKDIAGSELWDFSDRIDEASFLLRNTSDEPAEVECILSRYIPEKKWQHRGERTPLSYYTHHNEAEWGNDNRFDRYCTLAQSKKILPPHFEGYVSFDLNISLDKKDHLCDDDRLALYISTESQAIQIAQIDDLLPFVRRIDGISCDDRNEKIFTVVPGACVHRLLPYPPVGEAFLVQNGYNRRFSENPQNMWKPAVLPAALTFDLAEESCIHQIRITFDTLERTAHEMPYESGQRVSGQCVKKYSLSLYLNNNEVYSQTTDENYHRLAVCPIPGIKADRIVLTILETWDKTRTPGVYEVRIY